MDGLGTILIAVILAGPISGLILGMLFPIPALTAGIGGAIVVFALALLVLGDVPFSLVATLVGSLPSLAGAHLGHGIKLRRGN